MVGEQEQQGTIGSSLLVFLLGVAVGATVAILYAPAPGNETRAQIAERSGQLKDRATEMTHKAAERAAELRERFGGHDKGAAEAEKVDTTGDGTSTAAV